MYDILIIKNSGKKVILTVVKDTEEKELMVRFRNQFEDYYANNTSKKSNTVAKDFFEFKYLSLNTIEFNLFSLNITLSNSLQLIFPRGFIDPATNPPDLV